MTHKNPELRAQAAAPATPAPASAVKRPVLPRKPQSLQAKKPAKFALEGNKWLIVSIRDRTFRGESKTMADLLDVGIPRGRDADSGEHRDQPDH